MPINESLRRGAMFAFFTVGRSWRRSRSRSAVWEFLIGDGFRLLLTCRWLRTHRYGLGRETGINLSAYLFDCRATEDLQDGNIMGGLFEDKVTDLHCDQGVDTQINDRNISINTFDVQLFLIVSGKRTLVM